SVKDHACAVLRPSHSRPTFRDDRDTPLVSRWDNARQSYYSEKRKIEYFLKNGNFFLTCWANHLRGLPLLRVRLVSKSGRGSPLWSWAHSAGASPCTARFPTSMSRPARPSPREPVR